MSFQRFLIASAFALATATSTAQAHAKLQASDPKAGSTLGTAPKQIRLQFTEALEPAFSTIKLTDASNAEVPLPPAKVDPVDPKALQTPLPALRAGTYRVQWSAMTHDSHKVKGELTFKIK
jgi:methionine-rich copper-binding protein CopC